VRRAGVEIKTLRVYGTGAGGDHGTGERGRLEHEGEYRVQFFVVSVISITLFCAFHFTPLIVAIVRHHRAKLAIGVTNVLLGWTVIGWIVALIWACNSNVEARA